MSGPDPIDPIEEADAAIRRLYEEKERLRAEVERLKARLALAEKVIEAAKAQKGGMCILLAEAIRRYEKEAK